MNSVSSLVAMKRRKGDSAGLFLQGGKGSNNLQKQAQALARANSLGQVYNDSNIHDS